LGALTTIQKPLRKAVPVSKGLLQNSVTGVGFDAVSRTVDNIFGSPVQRIFSVNLPIIGAFGPIDFLNYLVHANGLRISKNGIVAVVAAKIVTGALPSIGPIQLPGSPVAGVGSGVASGIAGAPV